MNWSERLAALGLWRRRVVLGYWLLALLALPLSAATPVLPSPRVPVTAVAFSPNGTNLLAGGSHKIRIHQINGTSTDWPCPFPKITGLAFSPDGQTLAISGGSPGVEGGALLFSWPQGAMLDCITNHGDVATAVTFHPQAGLLATAGADGVVQVLRWPQLKAVHTLKGHSGPVLAAAFSPDRQHLVTAGADRSIKIWDVAAGTLRRSLNQHTDTVHCLAFRPSAPSPDATAAFCASGSQDKTVRVWQPAIGRLVRIIRGQEGPVLAVAWSPKQPRLYSAGTEGIVGIIDADSDQLLYQWQAHQDWIYSLAVSADGTRLATADWAGVVKIWDARGGTPTLIQELR